MSWCDSRCSGGRTGYRPRRVESTPRRRGNCHCRNRAQVVTINTVAPTHNSQSREHPQLSSPATRSPRPPCSTSPRTRLPASSPRPGDEVKRRTRARAFDPATRFYADEKGQVVGLLRPRTGAGADQLSRGASSGFESAAPLLFDAALQAARARGLTLALRRLSPRLGAVLRFFADNGFAHAREMINYWSDPRRPADAWPPAASCRSTGCAARTCRRSPRWGRGIIRLPAEKLEAYFFSNPYFPAEAFLVLRDRDGSTPARGRHRAGEQHLRRREEDRPARPVLPARRVRDRGAEHQAGQRPVQLPRRRPGERPDGGARAPGRGEPGDDRGDGRRRWRRSARRTCRTWWRSTRATSRNRAASRCWSRSSESESVAGGPAQTQPAAERSSTSTGSAPAVAAAP